jgi:L-iditol 2-dehydrogenase
LRAIRFHHRPVRYLWTRWAAARRPGLALGRTGCIAFDEVRAPRLPGRDWVRVRTTLSGICGSDLAAVTAHDSFTLEPFGAFPFVFGHENVGVVEEVGPEAGDWSAGQRVIVNPMLACRQRGLEPACPPCRRGEYGLCRRTGAGAPGPGPMIGYSPGTGGGWSAGFVAHASQLHAADGLSDEVAVLADPFVSALRAVLLHPPEPDDEVLVIGAGSIGVLAIRALRLTGWRGGITVLGRHAFQLELAAAAGAERGFRDRRELYAWAAALPDAQLHRPTLAPPFVEGGPSLVFDTVGSQRTLTDALGLVREGGRLVLVGSAAVARADWTRVWYRQLRLAGVFAYGAVPFEGASHDIYDVALGLMRAGGLGDLDMVTHIFALEDYRAALATALDKTRYRSVKVAFRPG